MKKIVINTVHGGFNLSPQAQNEYNKSKGVESSTRWTIKRDDPLLIAIVERMGPAADGSFARLKVVEIPDDVEWQIEEYDGLEWIAEKHRTWE